MMRPKILFSPLINAHVSVSILGEKDSKAFEANDDEWTDPEA